MDKVLPTRDITWFFSDRKVPWSTLPQFWWIHFLFQYLVMKLPRSSQSTSFIFVVNYLEEWPAHG